MPTAPTNYEFLNVEEALIHTAGDLGLLRALASSFMTGVPAMLATLHDCHDPTERRRAAHSLKGNLRIFGAKAIALEAELLELSLANNNLTVVAKCLAQLDDLVPRFCAELNSLVEAGHNECSRR